MSALGQKQTKLLPNGMSALPPIADIKAVELRRCRHLHEASAVATLAYDCRRSAYFTDQLNATLTLIDRGGVKRTIFSLVDAIIGGNR